MATGSLLIGIGTIAPVGSSGGCHGQISNEDYGEDALRRESTRECWPAKGRGRQGRDIQGGGPKDHPDGGKACSLEGAIRFEADIP
jgi:hypothetical protein